MDAGDSLGQSLLRVLTLDDYNTRLVVLATMVLGTASGIVGSFTLLRKRALLGDALSHATLPGIGLAFLLAPRCMWMARHCGIDGWCGDQWFGWDAVDSTDSQSIEAERGCRVRDRAQRFFWRWIGSVRNRTTVPEGHAAGLESFIYGKTASIIAEDAWWILIAGSVSVLVLFCLYKELRLLCFDDGYARSRGYLTGLLDFVLMATVVWVTIVACKQSD